MRHSIRITQVLCEAAAGVCLALAVLLFSATPAQAVCNFYCPDGDCYVDGIPPTCAPGTCAGTRGYPGCGGCLCQQPLGKSYCGCN